MPTDTSAEILVKGMVATEEELVSRAIERGGLPTEAEGNAFAERLNNVVAELERLAHRTEWIAAADTSSVPFDVSLEQVGVLAVLASDLDLRASDIARETERIRRSISGLAAIRADQQLGLNRESRS